MPANANQLMFLKIVRMCAAAWGCCYPEDRDFETIWKRRDDGTVVLIDAAEDGAFSFQVEGVIVRYLLGFQQPLPLEEIGLSEKREDDHITGYISRKSWDSSFASEEDWEKLRADLYDKFYDNGAGFYAHDLKFADLAIDWLKSGKPCTAGSCSSLPSARTDAGE